ncbi:MAG: ABC transporter substrate-binding protein [Tepidisphaera sp.]|nr:ABC transporter substrate-binding protein [Tepidisphaera sp.]
MYGRVMTILAAALLAAFALWAACCRRAPAPPAPTAGGPRVVALSPAVGIILQDLGREGLIVGRHGSDMTLSPSLPVCGDHLAIDIEALQRVHPTLVLTQWGTRDLPEAYVSLAKREGWATHDCQLLTVDDIRREIGEIDALLPAPHDKAKALVAEFDRVLTPRPSRKGAGKVLLLSGIDPVGALGPGSWHHQMLVAMGGTPAIEQGAAWIDLASEDLVRLGPDAIIVLMPRSPRTPPRGKDEAAYVGEEAIARLPELARTPTPAFKSKHIAVIDDPLSLTPSTAMIRVARQMGEALDAWSGK